MKLIKTDIGDVILARQRKLKLLWHNVRSSLNNVVQIFYVAVYVTKAVPSRTTMAKTFDGPPTLERSGSEHRVGRLHPSFLRREGLVRMWSSPCRRDGEVEKLL